MKQHIGFKRTKLQEPIFTEPLLDRNDPRLNDAYTWYTENYKAKNVKSWVVDYIKHNNIFTKDEVKRFIKSPDYNCTMTMCSIARIVHNGYVPPKETIEYLHGKIREAIASYIEKTEEEIDKPNVQTFIKEKLYDLIGDIEVEVDKFVANKFSSTFSLYDFLAKHNIKTVFANKIYSYYEALYKELDDAINKVDEQLVEAYEHLSKKELKSYREFVNQLMVDANTWSKNQKNSKPRKEKKKKEKPIEKIIGKLKFKKENVDLKIISIPPSKILGAQSLWVYNDKKKSLTVYNASAIAGLGIKGTTITGFDESTSCTKRIRKPDVILPLVLTSARIASGKIMGNIKAVAQKISGRINDDTLLLKVI